MSSAYSQFCFSLDGEFKRRVGRLINDGNAGHSNGQRLVECLVRVKYYIGAPLRACRPIHMSPRSAYYEPLISQLLLIRTAFPLVQRGTIFPMCYICDILVNVERSAKRLSHSLKAHNHPSNKTPPLLTASPPHLYAFLKPVGRHPVDGSPAPLPNRLTSRSSTGVDVRPAATGPELDRTEGTPAA